MKKAKFHYEAAAMAGHGPARCNIGLMELKSGNTERSVKHRMIAASTGDYNAMHGMITLFTQGAVSKESIDSTLAAYNNSCVEMRSEARDAYLRFLIDHPFPEGADSKKTLFNIASVHVSVLCYQSRSNILNDNFVVRRESYRSARQLLERQLLDCRHDGGDMS
jgi:TPR repeat protein